MTKTDIEKILFIDIETVPVIYKYNELNESTKGFNHYTNNSLGLLCF